MASISPSVVMAPALCRQHSLRPQTVQLGLAGQACHFCPSNPYRIAVATSQLFGICGKGQLLVVELGQDVVQTSAAVQTGKPNTSVAHATNIASTPFDWQGRQAHPPNHTFASSDAQKGAADAALESTNALTKEEGASARITAVLTTKDAINDCVWSPKQNGALAAACGDGTICLWSIVQDRYSSLFCAGEGVAYPLTDRSAAARASALPAAEIIAHDAEVCTVDWSPRHPHVLLSGSWDATARVWDTSRRSQQLLRCLRHPQCVYAARFSPHLAAIIASVSGDGRLRIFDLHMPSRNGTKPALESGFLRGSLQAHFCEALCLDWSHSNAFQLFTGGTDGTVSAWDIRQLGAHPPTRLHAHSLAVRAVRCNPFDPHTIATASYDTTVKIHHLLNCSAAQLTGGASTNGRTTASCASTQQERLLPPAAHLSAYDLPRMGESTAAAPCRSAPFTSFVPRETTVFAHHAEFVLGIDWSPFFRHFLASTSWDRYLCLWNTTQCAQGHTPRPCSRLQPCVPS